MLESFTEYEIAWGAYLAGSVFCTLATWMMFRPFGRAWVHFFTITVMVLLFTPFALNADNMMMAPGIFHLFFGFLETGKFATVKPVVKLMLGIWVLAQVISLVYQILTRHWVQDKKSEPDSYQPPVYDEPVDILMTSSRHLTQDERQARDELLSEKPFRAIR
ncbi:MAG: hypothetical protein ACI4NJ_10055 [Cellvibrio sp.]